jgi:hypothetical protein
MSVQNKLFTEQEIILQLKKNNLPAWINLYDTYAPAMYGLICSVIKNDNVAEQILIKVFCDLKKQDTLSKLDNGLCVALLKYSYSTAINHLKEQDINFRVPTLLFKDFSFVY